MSRITHKLFAYSTAETNPSICLDGTMLLLVIFLIGYVVDTHLDSRFRNIETYAQLVRVLCTLLATIVVLCYVLRISARIKVGKK